MKTVRIWLLVLLAVLLPVRGNACSAYCSLTPFVSARSTLLDPVEFAAVKFPDLSSAE